MPIEPELRSLRLHRTLLLCGGGGYLVWWLFVHASLPDAFNPFGSRAAACACFFVVLGASYRSRAVAQRLDSWLAACCCVATAHYFYLFDRNNADLNWMVGSYITVTAVCALLQTSRSLIVYSVFVALVSVAMVFRHPGAYVVFLPGMLTGLVFANVGLQSRLRVLARLARSEAALLRANRDLESFSYSVAHDLRAPLRAITGFSQVLLEDQRDKLDDEGKRHLDRISGGAETMGRLVDALLGLARLTRKELQREPVDLSARAAAIATQLEADNPARKVDVVIEKDLVADGDPELLGVVVDNLLGNAWKFTKERSRARVAFGRRVVEGEDVYFVEDNGAGFDMAYIDKLFAPFHRLHSATEFPGTGIGLATVQRIVDRHGGRVWAEGAVDHGATFFFTLTGSAARAS